jgi:sugar lactone lactonase YvrE
MRHRLRTALLTAAVVLVVASSGQLQAAQGRTEVVISETGSQAENLTSSQDGAIFFGSTATGTIYRAAPGASQATPWIAATAAGLSNVLGVLADDKTNTLWVCQNSTGGRGGAPAVGQTALRSFDLKSGAAKGTFPFPSNGGVCNDMAIASDGTVYATESFNNRIHRLKPGAQALDLWVPADPRLAGVDGIAVLGNGSVYVNTFFAGQIFRIPVNADGTAGALQPVETSIPLTRPDGMRAVGPRTLLQAEGQGRLTEVTITGDRAEVRVLRESLTAATGVTLVGDQAFVLVDRTKGVPVPYRPR